MPSFIKTPENILEILNFNYRALASCKSREEILYTNSYDKTAITKQTLFQLETLLSEIALLSRYYISSDSHFNYRVCMGRSYCEPTTRTWYGMLFDSDVSEFEELLKITRANFIKNTDILLDIDRHQEFLKNSESDSNYDAYLYDAIDGLRHTYYLCCMIYYTVSGERY